MTLSQDATSQKETLPGEFTKQHISLMSSKAPGIVYLVGAGPGHPGLITRWGYELLQQCDAVAYDALIPMELIAELPERVEKHYVGKRAGKHSLPQSQINELLAALARRSFKVVRLKGGDPFIYGRSSEEAEYLAASGIPVVMIPGVTAASAAAALSGFSLTNRLASSWVLLATGHSAESANIPVPWDKIGALPGGTLVVYMGLAKLDRVVEQLLSSGLAPDTPTVAVQAASTGLQKCVEAPLIEICSECRKRELKPPVLVIIGEAVRYRAKNVSTEAQSLAGKTVLVTCPSSSMARMCALLRKQGAEPIPYPTIVRTRVDDIEGWDRFRKLVNYGGTCLFQSEDEIGYFADGLLAHGLDMRSLGHFKIIAVAESADSALLTHNIKADWVLQRLEPKALADRISRLIPDASLPLIWVRGSFGKCLLETSLQEKCSGAISLTVCLDSTAIWDARWRDELLVNPPDYIALTSASEVEAFVELLGSETARHLADRSCVAAMNNSVAEMLLKHGLPIRVSANASSIDAFVCTLIDNSRKQVADSVISAGRIPEPGSNRIENL
jgi:uroporphyrinogen III methyltransferase / synthase